MRGEKNRGRGEAFQNGSGEGSAHRGRRRRNDGERSEGFWASERAHRDLSRPRIHGQLSSQGKIRNRCAGRTLGTSSRSHFAFGQNRKDWGRKSFCHGSADCCCKNSTIQFKANSGMGTTKKRKQRGNRND